MNTNRHAYALTEVLVIMVVIIVLIGLSVKPLRKMIVEAPRSAEACRTMNLTEKALQQLAADIAQARKIVSLNDQTLTLEQTNETVLYTLTDGQITRRNGNTEKQTWTLPNVHIEAELLKQNNTPYAVTLKTCDRQVVLGREQTRFSQTRVFFLKEQRR